jgi:ABC-2 type transport system ATP-binding protein
MTEPLTTTSGIAREAAFSRETPAISLEHVSKEYRSLLGRRSVTALEDVSLQVLPGEVFGFLGANGAGKTTTVKILLRLARPTAGRARIFGLPPGGAVRHRIGYVPESPYFYEFLTPFELLDFYAGIFGIPGRERKRRIQRALEQVGIGERSNSPIRTFSKGMVQRVGLAQALLNEPDVLFLDEPTSGLDPLARREIRDIILDLKSRGKTLFINSHLLSEVELVCDRVAILKRGRLVRTGTIDELVSREGVEVVVSLDGGGVPASLGAFVVESAATDETGTVRLRLPDEGAVPDALRALLAAGLHIVSVNPHRDTLEEVFVRIERQAP